MRLKLSLALIAFGVLTCPAQKSEMKAGISDDKNVVTVQQKTLKKQTIADDFDRQANDIPFADIRVFVRTQLATWLWREGKDETGRAEALAVKAFEEIYAKKDEIVDARSLKANLLMLLETNANATAQQLKTKYNVSAQEDLLNANLQLNQKDGDKIVGEKVKKALATETDLATIQLHLRRLQLKKSPEFTTILFEIIRLQEAGINKFSSPSLYWVADNFNDPVVPNDLRIRFYKIVLNKAASILQSTNSGEVHFTDLLLFKILPEITANAPALAAQAAQIKSALAVKVPQGTKDLQEVEQRIRESSDQLASLIAEAEKTDNKNFKSSLLSRASRLAVEQQKFKLAADLIAKTIEEPTVNNSSFTNLLISAHDQQLGHILQTALGKNDFESADYAAKKITDDLKRADALLQFVNYFYSKKDFSAALEAYDKALLLTLKADNDSSKYSALFRQVSAANLIDRNRLSEIVSITADTFNKLPTLNVEDKPGTAKFKDYVLTIMRIDLYLYLNVINLMRMNRVEAVKFTNAINRREIRIVADLALEIGMLEPEKRQTVK